MEEKILIIEDEKTIADILEFNLRKEGFAVDTAYDGKSGLEKGLKAEYGLILLDIMLPVMDGFEVCKKLREKVATPIIMVTAKEEEVDKVLGLELGADDYITKPFSNRELIARVKSNLRRVNVFDKEKDNALPQNIVEVGDLALDNDQYLATKNGVDMGLTLREFELLKYLVLHAGQIFTRESLLKDVWDYEYYGDARTVDVTIRRLREKIEDEPAAPKYIMTKRGIGYYFQK